VGPCRRGLLEKPDHRARAQPPACPIGGCAYDLRQAGRDRVLAVRKERQTPEPAPNLQRDPIGQCPCDLRQVGRDGVPAVRKNIGHVGPCPSRWAIPGPIFLVARDGDPVGRRQPPHGRARGTVPLPGIAKSKAAQPIRQVGRDGVPAVRKNIGHVGPCPSRWAIPGPIFLVAGDGDPVGRRQPPHGRARGTVPLPTYRGTEGILGHLLIREVPCIWGQCPTGTGDCAPPDLSANRGRSGTRANP